MSRSHLASVGELSLAGKDLTYPIVAVAIALVALGFAAALVKTVLKAPKGTQKMQEIAGAVQEGAKAYLLRQFKTLAIFVVVAVVLLYLLPVGELSGSVVSVKIGSGAHGARQNAEFPADRRCFDGARAGYASR